MQIIHAFHISPREYYAKGKDNIISHYSKKVFNDS